MTAKKSERKDYAKRAEELLTPIAEENGVYVYDVEYVREGEEYYLNAYIDKEGGVNIGDCENVSRSFSDALDAEDFIKDPYTLIVSSPGLGRALTKDRHLKNSIGLEVEIGTYRALEQIGGKNVSGILKAFDADTVTIEHEPEAKPKKAGKGKAPEQETTGDLVIERKEIASIRLAIDF